MSIRALVEEHGGIKVLVTHPVHRLSVRAWREPQETTEWQNTIICADGWVHALSTEEEEDLIPGIPQHLRAEHHISIQEDGRALPL